MNPAEQARQAQLFQQLAQLPPDLRSFIAAQAVKEQKTVLPIPYWSTVRLQATRAAGPPVVLTVDTTSRKAFQYAIGQDMQVAGFAAGTAAQAADTNLLRAGETLDGADVWLWGLAAELCTNSEPLIAAQAWRDAVVELSLNGTQSIRIGTLGMFPAAAGLYGAGRSFVAEPPLNQPGGGDNGAPLVGYLANGNPMAGNFLRFPQPFKWCATGKGADASLSVITTPNRSIVVTCSVARAAAAGISAYTPPAALAAGTFVDIRYRLIAVAVSPRSQNV